MAAHRPSRFDLETAIATWRQFHAHRRVFLRDDLDELEQHLRDHTTHLVNLGLDEEAAFRAAVEALGDLDGGEAEYGKVYWGKLWRRQGQLIGELTWRFAMLANYLKIALRMLQKQKGYAFINVAGLAIGIACALLILLFVVHELSYNRFYANADRIYQLVSIDDGDRNDHVSGELVSQLQERFPEVEGQAMLTSSYTEVLVNAGGKEFFEPRFAKALPGFFDVFSFEAVAGDLRRALHEPNSIVLTESTAQRYFGQKSPIGQPLVVRNERRGEATESEFLSFNTARVGYQTFEWKDVAYTVTAVVKDVPATSSLQFDFLASLSGEQGIPWAQGFVLLREGASVQELEQKLKDDPASPYSDRVTLRLQPLTEVHLHPEWPSAEARTGPLAYLYIFSIVALAMLLVACINYVNLATARSARRAREVGQRKVVGATHGQIILQFLGESALMALLAFGLALLLTWLVLPTLNAMLGTGIVFSWLASPLYLWMVVALAAFVAVVSGSFPAFMLARVPLTRVLKGLPVRGASGTTLRKGLVVFQFTACVVLALATLIAYKQLEFIRTARLDAHDDEVLVIENGKGGISGNYDAFRQALLARPEIHQVALGSPPGGGGLGIGTDLDSNGTFEMVRIVFADEQYFETLGLEFVAGTGFKEASVDPEWVRSVVVNETAARLIGEPDLVGSQHDELVPATIAGIVKDYHIASLHERIPPIIIQYSRANKWTLLVRLRSGAIAEGLAQVQEVWRQFVPDQPLHYSFLDDRLDEDYRAELRMSGLLGAFASLILCVAALGLFGLAAFTAEQRTKEIGIRKVLGATVASLIALLSKEFLKLVGFAFLVGAPIAYVLMHRWLEDFAYRVDLSWPLFLIAGLTALGVALLTVSYQAIKAALADPVKSLRYE